MRLVHLLRPALRALPFQTGKGRLAQRLMKASEIPAGRVIRMKCGVLVKTYSDGMYLHPYLYGEYEAIHTRLIEKLVRPGDTCLDVGANFGFYTALLAKCVGPQGRVYAFEPVPSIFPLAQETVALNAVGGFVKLMDCGLGREEGSFTVYTFPGLPHGHASSSAMGISGAVAHACKLTTLDNVVREAGIQSVDFLKIDVEGDELAAFEGGRELLGSAQAPMITFEINPQCLAARSLTPGDVEACLRRLGYTDFYRIPHHGRVDRVAKLGPAACDYLALKPSRAGRFSA